MPEKNNDKMPESCRESVRVYVRSAATKMRDSSAYLSWATEDWSGHCDGKC